LNWRVTFVQFLANTVVIGALILLLPGFALHASNTLLAILWLAVVFGVLSALVRPALEFLFLPYLLQSLGLVVVVINGALLALLGLTSVLVIKSFATPPTLSGAQTGLSMAGAAGAAPFGRNASNEFSADRGRRPQVRRTRPVANRARGAAKVEAATRAWSTPNRPPSRDGSALNRATM
jgi:uncharacterized membrane protein YvlD (DUF360 family)